MPIYEYRCAACGAEFERLVRSFAQAVEAQCPQCHSDRVQRRISRPAAVSAGADAARDAACAPSG